MRDFPGPERGILCILIIDIISKSALVLFSLLRASNYYYNKGALKVEFIKYKIIHSGLLPIENYSYFYSRDIEQQKVHYMLFSIGPQLFSHFRYVLY